MEDYKKLYKQTQRNMKEFIKRWDGIKLSSNDLFTEELKQIIEIQSEDEKIRAAIIHFISHTPTVPKGVINKETMIAWLEKQGEQKPNPCDGCINRKGCINCENGELREVEQKPTDEEMKELLRTEYEKGRADAIAEMCKHYDKASHSGLRDFYDNVKVKCKDAKEYDKMFPQAHLEAE